MATATRENDATVTVHREAGPLTAVFTTPDFCAPGRWRYTDVPALSSSICMPPNFNRYHAYKYGFYSPGICPMGYTEGCAFPKTLARTINGTPFFGGTLMAGETARICCPTGYTCYTGSDERKTYSECIAASKTTFLGYDYASQTYLTTVTDALAFAIQVRWQSSDLPHLETDPTVPGSKFEGPMPTATGDATGGLSAAQAGSVSSMGNAEETGAAAGPGTGNDGRMGIPTGAIIAVGVAVPLISVLLGFLAFFLWRRRYKRNYVKPMEDTGSQELSPPVESEGKSGFLRDGVPSSALVSPMTPRTVGFGSSTTELDSGTVNEMDATTINELDPDSHPWMELETREQVAELPSTFVAELPGDMPPATWTNTTNTSRSTDSHLRQRSGSRRDSFTRVKTKS
ncbi:hypothetical protein PG996_005708 [Apiospora saccharicola]|uniref:Uncharacterized protein n=1 Tax=Apiospora saccharicola TaxID=335842 RepID=A0ABR1VM91_9PEZI